MTNPSLARLIAKKNDGVVTDLEFISIASNLVGDEESMSQVVKGLSEQDKIKLRSIFNRMGIPNSEASVTGEKISIHGWKLIAKAVGYNLEDSK